MTFYHFTIKTSQQFRPSYKKNKNFAESYVENARFLISKRWNKFKAPGIVPFILFLSSPDSSMHDPSFFPLDSKLSPG